MRVVHGLLFCIQPRSGNKFCREKQDLITAKLLLSPKEGEPAVLLGYAEQPAESVLEGEFDSPFQTHFTTCAVLNKILSQHNWQAWQRGSYHSFAQER